MPYIALKPCEFGGKKYVVNDIIPDEVIAKPKKLVETKVIAPQKGEVTEPVGTSDKFNFPLLSDGSIMSVEISVESLSTALLILQKNADDAVQAISECDDTDTMLAVYSLDSRKSVKNAADKRTSELNGQGDE